MSFYRFQVVLKKFSLLACYNSSNLLVVILTNMFYLFPVLIETFQALKSRGFCKSLTLVPPILTSNSFSSLLKSRNIARESALRAPYNGGRVHVVPPPLLPERPNDAFVRQSANMMNMITCSITNSSHQTYQTGYVAFSNWCKSLNIDVRLESIHPQYIPSVYGFKVHVITTFLGFLATDLRLSPNTIHVYKYGVRDAFRRLHLDLSFFDHEALGRMHSSIVVDFNSNHEKSETRRLPFTLQMYKLGKETLWNKRLPTGHIIILAIEMGIALLARASEMLYSLQQHFIRSQDVLFHLKDFSQSSSELIVKTSEVHKYVHLTLIGITISFRSAKNDQAGEGHKFHYAVRSLSVNCLFCLATNMFEWAVRARPPDELPFLSFFGASIDNNFYLKYDTMLSEIKKAAFAAGFDPARFGVHSLRIGGATILAAAKYPNHYIQTLGRWKSLAFLSYIHWALKSMEHAMTAIVDPVHFSNNDLIRLNPSARLTGSLTIL